MGLQKKEFFNELFSENALPQQAVCPRNGPGCGPAKRKGESRIERMHT